MGLKQYFMAVGSAWREHLLPAPLTPLCPPTPLRPTPPASNEQLTLLALAAADYTFLEPGERQALQERMEAAVLVEAVDNTRSPFCLFSGSGACSR